MPIDPAMSAAMLGTFRDLLTGARDQGLTGPDVEEMAAALDAMDALAQQLSDVGEFSTRLANDGYYTRFTDAYSRAMLAAAGGTASAAGEPAPIKSDPELLDQTLAAYESSLAHLRTVADQEQAVAAVERILEIGRSGVNYPVFLRQLEEEGLGEVLAGSVTPKREHLVADVDHHAATIDPARQALAAALVAAYDGLATQGPVDPFAYELRRFETTARHAPTIALRDAVVSRLPRLLDLVIDWLGAHTSWAPFDDRFRSTSDAETRKNVERARECSPGFYEVRNAQFTSYFGPRPWWERPELAEERTGGRILWTDERIALALAAVRHCTPETPVPPADLVARAEAFGANNF